MSKSLLSIVVKKSLSSFRTFLYIHKFFNFECQKSLLSIVVKNHEVVLIVGNDFLYWRSLVNAVN